MGGRTITVLGTAALTVGMLAAPASAHVWFKGDNWVAANSDQELTLNVPEEAGPGIHNASVVAKLPQGWKAVSCTPVAGWQCALDLSAPAVRWTRGAGAPDVEQETFRLTVRTGDPDDYVYVPIIQTYAGGKVVEWTGNSDSDCPAPAFKVYKPKHASPAPSPTPSPAVLGIRQERPQVLPRTGTSVAVPAGIGALLTALGSGILLAGRRRRNPEA